MSLSDLVHKIKFMQYKRVSRGLNDLIYLLDVDLENKKVKVAGTTKNVYTVDYTNITCDCPDYTTIRNGEQYVCKHICFVICKIGKIIDTRIFNERSMTRFQINHLESRLKSSHDSSIVDISLIEKFNKMHIDSDKVVVIDTESECPICFSELHNTDITTCSTCKNHVHTNCLRRWLSNRSTCVYCRSRISVVDDRYISLV